MSERGEQGAAEAALAAHTERLLRIPGVVGVGAGLSDDGRPAVHVYFNPSAAAGRGANAMIPKTLGDVPVKVIETDDIGSPARAAAGHAPHTLKPLLIPAHVL